MLYDLEERPDFARYSGKMRPAMGYHVMDFDSEKAGLEGYNVQTALNDAHKVIEHLGLTQKSCRLFFSGNKGFHLYIDEDFFGFDHDEYCAKHFKEVEIDLIHEIGVEIDLKITHANRKFRIPGSKHPKSHLYKTEIPLDLLNISEIKNLASNPQNICMNRNFFDERYKPTTTNKSTNNVYDDKINKTHRNPIDAQPNHRRESEIHSLEPFGTENLLEEDNLKRYFETYKEKPCIKVIQKTKFKEGKRHEAALVLIQDYFQTGLPYLDAKKLVHEFCALNEISTQRFQADYVRALDNEYNGNSSGKTGCYKGSLKYEHCSHTCDLWDKLDRTKRAIPKDLPIDIQEKEAKQVTQKKDSEAKLAKARALNPISGWTDWTGKSPSCTIKNVETMLKHLNVKALYNVIKKDMQIVIPNHSYLIDDEKNSKLTYLTSFGISCGMAQLNKLYDCVKYVANGNPFNPVAEWILTKKWDGVNRLPAFYNTLNSKNDHDSAERAFKETLIKRWMISAIAATFEPKGISAHGVLVLSGAQYIGKTNWFKQLAPKELNVLKDGVLLDPKDKDSVYQSVTNWIVELGEIGATFKKADIDQLKAFITKESDELRLPYQRESSTFPRRTVFMASVNDDAFLQDPTGNRRFWTIECESINHSHGMDMQQVWAEVYELYLKGERWTLDKDEMAKLNESNQHFESFNPFEEKILDMFDWSEKLDPEFGYPNGQFMTCTQVFESISQVSIPSKKDLNSISTAVKKITGQKITKYMRQRGYYMPRLKIDENSYSQASRYAL